MKYVTWGCVGVVTCMYVFVHLSFAADNCISIEPGKTGRAVLKEPGNYCLTQNLIIDGSYNPLIWEGSKYLSKDHVALVIAANDVTVDLKGNAVLSDAREVMAGVQSALVNTGEPTTLGSNMQGYRKKSWDAAYRNIAISNGAIHLNRGNFGVMFPGSSVYYGRVVDGVPIYFHPANTRPRVCDEFFEDKLPPVAQAYPVRNIKLDKLDIRSPNCGVVVQGAKTIIRNSVIETDSQVGIWIFGPDAIIENNTIIVHERGKDSIDPVRPNDAPIRLHQADGSIIRNNRIILRTVLFSRTKGTAAIDLLDSKNVVVENNTIEDFQDLLRKDNASSVVEHDNKLR